MTEEEKRKKEFLEGKKQWVDKDQDFHRVFGKYDNVEYIPNYVSLTSSAPISENKFRAQEKNKWIAKKDFIVTTSANKDQFFY